MECRACQLSPHGTMNRLIFHQFGFACTNETVNQIKLCLCAGTVYELCICAELLFANFCIQLVKF